MDGTRRVPATLVAAAAFLAGGVAVGMDNTEPGAHASAARDVQVNHRLRDAQLLVHFQGKGSALPYDGGVIKKAFQCIPALRDNRVVIGGNSSGSFLAAYFSCVGFTQQTVDYAERRLLRGDETAIQGVENAPAKAAKMMRGLPTEIPHLELKEYIAFALGVKNWRNARSLLEIARQSRYTPYNPVVIVAANKEVLDNLLPGALVDGQNYKTFDRDNFSLSWTPDVFAYYQKHPEQFRQDHPDLRLGPDRYIGKACTYFVDQTMFDLLKQIPADERLADLRLMTSPEDLMIAMVASAAEPTYFPPLEETNYQKLMAGDTLGARGNSRTRVYCGGYVMSLVGHDVRRMLPGVRVLGTGWVHLPHPARKLLQAMYLVDMEPVSNLNSWWTDMEITPSWEIQKQLVGRKLTADQEFQYGWETATRCLQSDHGLPQYVQAPKHNDAAQRALLPNEPVKNIFQEATTGEPNRRLKTLRGLGDLIDRTRLRSQ